VNLNQLELNEFMTNTNKVTDTFLITKEFNTPTEFSQYVEKTARINGTSCWDSLLDYCSRKDIEPESINKLLNTNIKSKIEAELTDLNLIKGKNQNKLPF